MGKSSEQYGLAFKEDVFVSGFFWLYFFSEGRGWLKSHPLKSRDVSSRTLLVGLILLYFLVCFHFFSLNASGFFIKNMS